MTTTKHEQELENTSASHGISRRTLARGLAWTAPVVLTSVTVPAFAASTVPCTKRTVATLSQTQDTWKTLVFPDSTITAGLTYKATNKDGADLSDQTPGDTGEIHRTVYPGGVPDNWNYLKLHHPAGMDQGDLIVLTIDFTAAVKGLSLTITDIDRDTDSWIDHVWVTPTTFAPAKADPTFLEGSGTAADPWVADVPGDDDPDDGDEDDGDDDGITSNRGDVTLTWPGSVMKVEIFYKAADIVNNSGRGEHIGVGLVSFLNCP